jgi:hypothetical protein
VLEAHAGAGRPPLPAAPHPGDAAGEHERIPERGRHHLQRHHRFALHAGGAGMRIGDLDARAAEADVAHPRVVGEAPVPPAQVGVEIDAAPGVHAEVIAGGHRGRHVITARLPGKRGQKGKIHGVRGVTRRRRARLWCSERDREYIVRRVRELC